MKVHFSIMSWWVSVFLHSGIHGQSELFLSLLQQKNNSYLFNGLELKCLMTAIFCVNFRQSTGPEMRTCHYEMKNLYLRATAIYHSLDMTGMASTVWNRTLPPLAEPTVQDSCREDVPILLWIAYTPAGSAGGPRRTKQRGHEIHRAIDLCNENIICIPFKFYYIHNSFWIPTYFRFEKGNFYIGIPFSLRFSRKKEIKKNSELIVIPR